MKAVMIMFDTLVKDFLPNYGNTWVHAPNFKKLSKKMITFNNFYGGSMPCMPARRELHTGKYNFLHRGWGPLEIFDQSVFELLNKNNIYTHLVTDHSHYWEDGGSTYHNRYETWEGFRGQEGDRWQPRLIDLFEENNNNLNKNNKSYQQHLTNRQQYLDEDDFPSVKTINAGAEFIEKYYKLDNWFLQIECFDPHEPFYTPEKYKKIYNSIKEIDLPYFPKYQMLQNATKNDVENLKKEYASMLSMVDYHLGKLIDLFDKYNMWQDTLIMINTDHGFLLGEHGFVGKNFTPMYEEIIHIPFFLNIPERQDLSGTTIDKICQTIDIAPTLLDYFKVQSQKEIDGKSIIKIIKESKPVEKNILFGINGGHVCIFDGQYVYMRGSKDKKTNQIYKNYTSTFALKRGFISEDEYKSIKLVKGNNYSNGLPLIEISLENKMVSFYFGNQLFDLKIDPKQLKPIKDNNLEKQMIEKLIIEMKKYDAPASEFERLGLI